MGCFCHASMAPLTATLPTLQANLSANLAASAALPGANIAQALAAWLAEHGLPAAPWTPEPAWLSVPLPQLRLSLSAVATISALAQLRAQVLAQLGLDLLQPAQARAFARVIATLNARMSALAAMPTLGAFSPQPWVRLASLNSAIEQVQLALQAGLFAPSQSLLLALTLPGGQPMTLWAAFLAQLRKLAPMIAAATQLNVSLSETTQLSAALRALAGIALPPLAAPQLMGSLTAALSAVARLQASLGVNPLQIGLPALTAQIQARLNVMLRAVASTFGLKLAGANPEALLAALLGLLPHLPMVPTSLATAPVVTAALSAHALAGLNWNVPALLPATQIGLPACAFAAQLQTSFGITPVLASPCGSGCDAAKLMAAAEQALSA
ncbi:MAG TPA: hypothetical protein VNE67_07890 [Acetobacteraceae bacterium]|nr:hypothetical protein [Acetobacteraceae bacterium]